MIPSAFRSLAIGLALALTTSGFGCGDSKPPPAQLNIQTSTLASVDTDDFNLGQVYSLIAEGKNADLKAFEATINDPDSGINNVDLDKDGVVDYVSIGEQRPAANTVELDFYANPKTGAKTQIAVVSIEKEQNGDVAVSAMYDSGVRGYESGGYHNTYHHDSFDFGDALLLSYLMTPSRSYYYPSYSPYSYTGYRTRTPSQLSTTRTSYSTTTSVSPAKKTTVPSTSAASKSVSASKQKSSAASTGSAAKRGTSNTVTGAAYGMNSYGSTSSAQQKQKAAKPATTTSSSSRSTTSSKPTTAARPASSKPSSSWGSSSKKSSWGSSSSSRSRSSGRRR